VQADSGSANKPSSSREAARAGGMRVGASGARKAGAPQGNAPGAATASTFAHFQEDGSGLQL